MNILVFGAGALGSVYAARLSAAGHDVSILARGQRLAQIRSSGIVIEDALSAARRITARPRLIESLPIDAPYDLVIVLVRKNQLASVLPQLAANRCTPNVLVMTNNAAGSEELTRSLGRQRVLLGFPGAGGGRTPDGTIQYSIAPAFVQPTTIGELDGQRTERLIRIANILREAGFPTRLEPRMDAWLKTHAAWITPVGAAILRENGDTRRVAHNDATLRLLVESVREAMHTLDVLGISPTPPLMERLFRRLPLPLTLWILRWWFNGPRSELYMGRHARTAGDEMAFIAAEVQSLARSANVPTPAMDELFDVFQHGRPRHELAQVATDELHVEVTRDNARVG